jgi:hypothetical protein
METIDTKIETGLQILDEKETSLIELKARCSGLKISGIEDKQGFKAVREARLTLKDARVQIQKDGKSLRENAIRFQKAVIEKENQLIDIIAPIEKELQQEEETYNSLVEQERLKKEREEDQRIQKRIDALAKFNHGLDVYEAKIMPEEDYQALLGHAEAEYLKEQERIAAEKAKAEQERIAEQERLRVEREELQRQQAEFKKREAELNALREREVAEAKALDEQRRIERERQEAELKAEREKLEKERRAMELEKAKAEAAERAKVEEQQRIQRAEQEKIERERLAKIEAQRQELLKPDKEKALGLASLILSFVHSEQLNPLFSDPKVTGIIAKAHGQMQSTAKWIEDEVSKL